MRTRRRLSSEQTREVEGGREGSGGRRRESPGAPRLTTREVARRTPHTPQPSHHRHGAASSGAHVRRTHAPRSALALLLAHGLRILPHLRLQRYFTRLRFTSQRSSELCSNRASNVFILPLISYSSTTRWISLS